MEYACSWALDIHWDPWTSMDSSVYPRIPWIYMCALVSRVADMRAYLWVRQAATRTIRWFAKLPWAPVLVIEQYRPLLFDSLCWCYTLATCALILLRTNSEHGSDVFAGLSNPTCFSQYCNYNFVVCYLPRMEASHDRDGGEQVSNRSSYSGAFLNITVDPGIIIPWISKHLNGDSKRGCGFQGSSYIAMGIHRFQ